MTGRLVAGFRRVNDNIMVPSVIDMDQADIQAGNVGYGYGVAGCVITETGDEALHQTIFTLTDVAQAVASASRFQSTKLYTFPKCRMNVLGVTASLQQKTTSVIASTINSGVTGAVALGTAAASNVSLTSTMVDLLASTAFASSTVINTGGTAVGGLLAPAQFDGHTTAKDLYLNSAFATALDVDADGTQTWTGVITITWANLGTHP
jgi:hypothetical protein